MVELAKAIDEIEEEIDDNGSIVIKQPDVWGEARWTAHRQQYEKQLLEEIDKFRFTVNATIRESDNAFLLNAQALSIAAATQSNGTTGTGINPFGSGDQPQIRQLNLPEIKPLAQDASTEVKGVAIEPTLFLDQLSRYQKHLNQLRRINEGDDTADAPGYALNLLRIPVSILPGDETRKGHGAEVSLAIEPELTDELLPSTFRSLVINDLVDQLGLPTVRLAESDAWKKATGKINDIEKIVARIEQLKKILDGSEVVTNKTALEITGEFEKFFLRNESSPAIRTMASVIQGALDGNRNKPSFDGSKTIEAIARWVRGQLSGGEYSQITYFRDERASRNEVDLPAAMDAHVSELISGAGLAVGAMPPESLRNNKYVSSRINLDDVTALSQDEIDYLNRIKSNVDSATEIYNAQAALEKIRTGLDKFQVTIANITPLDVKSRLSSPRARQATYAIPPSEVARVFGLNEISATTRAWDGIRETEIKPSLPDANAFLVEHLAGAFDFLTREAERGRNLWELFCPQISNALMGNDFQKKIENVREDFRVTVNITGVGIGTPEHVVKALAWPILVESTLLSERLNRDMKRVEREKECCILSDRHLDFYGPSPYQEAIDAFKKYVACRWPIHVFAIDPVNQSQNVADAFSRRRERQLALAVAFSSGDIGADSFNRFARQLDFEQQTISLNRTVVGFSHGNDSFGWRLYPRVQSPPVASNTEVKFRELMFGAPSRDRDLKQRQLEPGMRELLAIVIMPSFVPFARMDVRTSWFDLTDPNERRFTAEESVVLGRQIQEVRQLKARCLAGDCFDRPGEGRRLLTAVKQLEKRLPIQDMRVQIPYENSLGGFQLFANGSRHLGPELIGFYGEPGIDTGNETELFLVGKNFNVNVTRVIAGGKLITDQDLLSREILRVKIPKGTKTNKDGKVDIHVATPYGVSSHLHVPTVSTNASAAPKFSVTSAHGCATCKECELVSIKIVNADQFKILGVPPLIKGEITISGSLDLGTGSDIAFKTEKKLTPFEANEKGEVSLKDPEFAEAVNEVIRGGIKTNGPKVKCPDDDFAIVIKAKVQSVGKAAVSTSNSLRIQVKGCKAGCADTGSKGVATSSASVSTVHFRPGSPLKVQTNPFAEFQTDGFATLRRALADMPQAEVAFFAYAMEGGKRMQRVAAGPFRVRGGAVLVTSDGPVELSAKSIFQTEFKPGRNLESLLNSKLADSSKSDGIVLDAYARIPGQKSAQRVGDPIYLKVKRATEPTVRFGTFRNASRRTVVPQLVK